MRAVITPLVAILVVSGCDHAFEPFAKDAAGPYSMFGHLNVHADTQWLRVTPIRQNLLTDPQPINAIVSLEKLENGETTMLRDTLFRRTDTRLEGIQYARNFWTTQPLEPLATYRLKAVRSDGDSTTALVVMPSRIEGMTFRHDVIRAPGAGTITVRAENILFAERLHLCGGGAIIIPEPLTIRLFTGGFVILPLDELPRGCAEPVVRAEIRVTTAAADWPYRSDISDLDVTLPGKVASTVENGLGFVGGVAAWSIPYHACREITPRPGHERSCVYTYNSQSASIHGGVVRMPCGVPELGRSIRLVEEFPDGGSSVRSWPTGPQGDYRFEGIDPGTRMMLEFGAGVHAVRVPTLGPGERYVVEDVGLPPGGYSGPCEFSSLTAALEE